MLLVVIVGQTVFTVRFVLRPKKQLTVTETDCHLCEVGGETEETVGGLNITMEHDRLYICRAEQSRLLLRYGENLQGTITGRTGQKCYLCMRFLT
jgi:hypothetical protein